MKTLQLHYAYLDGKVYMALQLVFSVPESCKGQQLPPGWGLGAVEGPYGGQQGRFWQTEPDPPPRPAPSPGIGQLHRDQGQAGTSTGGG